MEADSLIPDENIAGFSKRILEREYEEIAKMSVAVIVSTAFDVINEYRERGMTFDQIATAYTKNGVPMKGATLRWAFGRAMKSRKSLQGAPAARGEEEQRNAQALPAKAPATVTSTVEPSPAPSAQAPAPRPAPVLQQRPLPGEKNEERRPPWISEEMWAMKPKIDKILKTYPTHDREYPELADARWWTDKAGKKWDVIGDEKPDSEEERRELDYANIRYFSRWRGLVEKWGLAEEIHGDLTPRYKIAEEHRKPLLVDLDEIIAKHLD